MVKIEITGDTPLETLASLTAFGMHCLRNEDVYAAANRILEAEQHDTRKAASASTPPPAPASDPMLGISGEELKLLVGGMLQLGMKLGMFGHGEEEE